MKSLLYNAEAFPVYTKKEIEELEKVQGTILRQFLEVPSSTPYYGLLMETGWITMEARLHYSKLVLFHNIMQSDNQRVLKQLLIAQKEENREGTWHHNICQLIERYEIELDVEETTKEKWKDEVKGKIRKVAERIVREHCCSMTKTRTVKNDKFELKT